MDRQFEMIKKRLGKVSVWYEWNGERFKLKVQPYEDAYLIHIRLPEANSSWTFELFDALREIGENHKDYQIEYGYPVSYAEILSPGYIGFLFKPDYDNSVVKAVEYMAEKLHRYRWDYRNDHHIVRMLDVNAHIQWELPGSNIEWTGLMFEAIMEMSNNPGLIDALHVYPYHYSEVSYPCHIGIMVVIK